MQSYENVDEYMANFSGDTRKKLDEIRKSLKAVIPKESTEKISYGIPTYSLNGNIVHFAGYNSHIGFYPGSVPIAEFKNRLAGYKTSKGTVQFPLDKPLPLDLIKDMAAICVERNKAKNKK